MNVFLQLALAGLLTNKNFITRLASAPKRTQNCLKSDGDLCRPVISCNMTKNKQQISSCTAFEFLRRTVYVASTYVMTLTAPTTARESEIQIQSSLMIPNYV